MIKSRFDDLLNMNHDEFFALDETRFHHDRGVLDIPWRRIFHDGSARMVRQRIIYTVRGKDVIRSRMCMDGVEEYEVQDLARRNTCSFHAPADDPDASEMNLLPGTP